MPNANTAAAYRDGYAEGRRSGLHCVVSMAESVVIASANQIISDRSNWLTMRAYWVGMKRGFRLHYSDAYLPTVLAARERNCPPWYGGRRDA